MSAVALIGFYFLLDFDAGLDSALGIIESNVGHWAHVGGMLAGFAVGWRLGCHRKAAAERQAGIGKERARRLSRQCRSPLLRRTRPAGDTGEGRTTADANRALSAALDNDPDNLDTLLSLAELKAKRDETAGEAAELFAKAIARLLESDGKRAAQLHLDALREHGVRPALPAEHALRVAMILRAGLEYEAAAREFEWLADSPDAASATREQALFRAAFLRERLGHRDAALDHFERLLREFPDSEQAGRSREKIAELQESARTAHPSFSRNSSST